MAHYEAAAICWGQRVEVAEKDRGSWDAQERFVRESEGWIEKAARWESYELDARIGLKVATAQDTLAKWRRARAAAVGAS